MPQHFRQSSHDPRAHVMTINAEWVSILKSSYPTAFKTSLNTVPVAWFVDGQIKLMKGAWITTWEVFFQMQFIRTIDRAFDAGAQVVIMGFDDYTHVPECKGMTQRKRNKSAKDFVYDVSKGLPEAPPVDWNAAMRNRIFKVAVIKFIVKNIKLHYKNHEKTVIVDWVGVPDVLGRPLSENGRSLPDCVLDAESKRGECDIKAFAWTGWGPTMIESTDGDFIPLALLQTQKHPSKRIFLERILTRTSSKRTSEGVRKRQMEFVDIASLHAHVKSILPRQQNPVETLAVLIALTGCDFCNSLPGIGPTKLWAARHLITRLNVASEAGALALISHAYTKSFATRIAPSSASDINASASSAAQAAYVYETIIAQVKQNLNISAQTRERIWSAAHMQNHVRNAMWTVLQYWSCLEAYENPTLPQHGYYKDDSGVCHFKID